MQSDNHPLRHLVLVTIAICLGAAFAEEPSFPEPYNAQEYTQAAFAPTKALETMRLPEGFQATLFAHEPEVQQPIAMATDERGRLWIAECYTYAEGAKNFDDNLRDRIVILEDTDGDGVHDRRKVFWNQGRKLTSIEIGLGGVWALCAPNLFFIPDRDRDDKPDSEPEIILDGWKDSALRHNIVNGLRWGPDGWLYGRQGILETSRVGTPGASESQRIAINCGVWRYHPIRKAIEVVLHGTTNPWGFDYDQHGEMFIINTVIGHLWHVVPGARTERMFGSDFNPYSYGLMGQVADHYHWDTREVWHAIRKGSSDSTKVAGGGHAHSGLLIYQGDNWPAEYRGKAFAINFHGRRLNQDRIERHGSGYIARHEPDAVFWEDPWFRGIDLATGHDGGVFVLDWSDTGECHEQDGIHRRSGRIYKICWRGLKPTAPFDLSQQPPVELVNLQKHTNDWWPRQARRVLRDRTLASADLSAAETSTRDLLRSQDAVQRLRAMWTLEALGKLSDRDLLSLSADADEHVRVWAVRFLADRLQPSVAASPEVLGAFITMANKDSSGLALLYLASALQRLSIGERNELLSALLSRQDFATDRSLALMLWYGLEPAVLVDVERTTALFALCRFPLVRQFMARRCAEGMETVPAFLNALLANAKDEPLHDAVLGMAQGLTGWARAAAPACWPNVSATLADAEDEPLRQALLQLGVLFGEGRSTQELYGLLENGSIDVRIRALRTLSQAKSGDLVALLLKLLSDRDLQLEAIRSLAAYDDAQIAIHLLASWPHFGDEARQAAVATLCGRPEHAKRLLLAVRQQQVPASAISAFHARQILAFNEPETASLLKELWGEVRETPESRRVDLARYTSMTEGDRLRGADLSRGRLLFRKTCASCHILFGEGRKLGPDLTGGNRKNLDYLLENIIDPSAVVAADFRTSNVLLSDGRTLSGVVTRSTDRTLTLLTDREDLTLDRREIDELSATNQSLMPEGLLKNLREGEIRDLFAYLMADGPVPLRQQELSRDGKR